MNGSRRTFVALSAELTGYSEVDLEGTELVDQYRALVERQVGRAVTRELETVARLVLRRKPGQARARAMRVDLLASPLLGPVALAIVTLWYLGSWKVLPATWYALAGTKPPGGAVPGSSIVPSAAVYTRQLAFRAAGAHPPGAAPTGYASWSIPPVFGDPLPPPEPS